MIVSIHIPKTAGTTFRSFLLASYANRVCLDYRDMFAIEDPGGAGLSVRGFRMMDRIKKHCLYRMDLRPNDECIHGHFLATKWLTQFPDADLVTWVRDPVERVVSHYEHWKRRPDRGNTVSRHLTRHTLSLEEFASLDAARNLQARYLDGVDHKRFRWLGVSDRYDQILPAIADELGVDVGDIRRNNVNPKKKGERYEVPAALRGRIVDWNRDDQDLYEAAAAR